MNAKVSANPIVWGRIDFPEIAKEIAEAGYEGVEAPVPGYLDNLDDLDKLRSIVDKYGLKVSSAYCGVSFLDKAKREDEIKRVLEVAEALKKFDCDIVLIASGGVRKPEGGHPMEEYKAFTAGCNEVGKRCKDIGVTAAFHNHAWTLIETKKEVDILCEMTDPDLLKMAFDTGHLALGGADPVETFDKYADRIAYVHLKDLREDADKYEWGAKFMDLGEGYLDLMGVKKVLDRINFDGWICWELDVTTHIPLESAKISRKYIKDNYGL